MRYVLDENKNLVEALDKEQVEALLAQAIQEGQLPSVDEDTAFVTMLKDPITGVSHKIVMCSQAKFNEMKEDDELISNAYYYITDDTTAEDLEAHLVQNDARVSDLEERATALEGEKRHFVGTATPTQGLEWLLEQCHLYWSANYTSRECYGTIIGNCFYFKLGSNDSNVSFTGVRFGNAVRDTEGNWTISYLGDEKATEIDPTSEITQTGLYAVSYRGSAIDNQRITWMLSIYDFNDGVDGFPYEMSALGVSLGTFSASFSYSTKKITIKRKKDGSVTNLQPEDIHLVAKY